LAADSKQQMVRSAAVLFREQGYSGTGFRDVIEHSGAPRGSIYHHFPGGKAELAAETVRYAGWVISSQIERRARDGDAMDVLRSFVGLWQKLLEESDFRAGCPVVAVAVEAHDDDALVTATGEVFAGWERALAASLRRSGAPQARARRISTLAIAAIEGAVVMCRAQRTTKPLVDVGRELEETIAAAQAG
jgi:AcrR family transcriptional regulator